jgi:hypothetical protein
VPFVLTPLGNAGAHRSWAVSYVGVTIVLGSLAASPWRPRWRSTFLVALLVVLEVGNYAVSQNAVDMFPGAYEVGADGRTMTPELVALAKEFGAQQGRGHRIAADRDVFVGFATYAGAQETSFDYPFWELFYSGNDEAVRHRLVEETGVQYVVFDEHAVGLPSATPLLFATDQPPTTTLIERSDLRALERYRWLSVVYRTPHYVVLRVLDGRRT